MTKTVEIYTDGALRRRKQLIGAWCYLILDQTQSIIQAKIETMSNITNNRMEITAVIKALQNCSPQTHIKLYTDSQYVIYGIKNGNTKTNQDLWQQYQNVVSRLQLKIAPYHVYGHQDNIGNNAVDLTMRQMINLAINKA